MAANSNVTTWATAISTHETNGRKIIFRFAKEFNETFDRSSQPVRVIIVWKYQSERGHPLTEDHQKMESLEDALESSLGDGDFATLALVSTGENLREWTYYTRSESEFMARLNFAFTATPTFPIEIYTAHDAKWTTYDEFIAGVTEAVNESPSRLPS